MKKLVSHRTFGYTGVDVSIIGIGGYHLGLVKTQTEANRIVHEAIDRGVNFFDNAWDYHDGAAETRMGKALKGRRDAVLLMTKVCTHGRDKKTAMRQLHESLRRLQTDHLDVWQIHEVIYANEPELYFRPGGAVEALDEAKRAGKVRFVGFTGHKDPAIHVEMLSHRYPFDTCQLPLNCFDARFRSFQQRVLPELHRQRITPIGMKSLGGEGQPVKKRAVNVSEALRYAMSLPVGTTVSGIDSLKVLRQNLRIATDFQPMSEEEMESLRRRTADAAADGHFELYKTSMHNDGSEGRRVHRFPSEKELTA
jgi:predicted aldo/keto reductase-like oxidoreductase